MLTIFRKELADHFSSARFLILFCLITMVALVITYMVGNNLRQELTGVAKPTYVFLMLFTSGGGAVFAGRLYRVFRSLDRFDHGL